MVFWSWSKKTLSCWMRPCSLHKGWSSKKAFSANLQPHIYVPIKMLPPCKKNYLKSLISLWDMRGKRTIKQNGGCSISLPQFDQFEPKLHQWGAFWTYYAGLEANQPLWWFKMETEYLWPILMNWDLNFTNWEHFWYTILVWRQPVSMVVENGGCSIYLAPSD